MAPARDDLFHQVHQPVMVSEVLEHLLGEARPARRRLVVDATLGIGGHAQAVLEARDETVILGIDRDPEALALARRRLGRFGERFSAMHGSYAELERLLGEAEEPSAWGVLFDLGASSLQFDDPERGFSFQVGREGADMRFDRTSDGPTALDLVNRLPEKELANLLHTFGEEPRARAVARRLVASRPIRDGTQLAEIVRRAAFRPRHHDAATRTFQALRIAVNEELAHLERGLCAAIEIVEPGGRVVVLSFHSGEDRRVKEAFREAARAGRGRVRTRKPWRPTDEEIQHNRRARAARLRAFEKREEGEETS